MIENASQIKEHMTVVGSDGEEVGVVDRIQGEQLKLTKDDEGQHHYLPMDLVASVSDGTVQLTCTASDAREELTDEADDDQDSLADNEEVSDLGAMDQGVDSPADRAKKAGSQPRKGGLIGEEPSSNIR